MILIINMYSTIPDISKSVWLCNSQRLSSYIRKRRGIVYPSFEIYGCVSGFYDYVLC